MKRLGSTRAAAPLGITGGAAVLAAILRWVQLSNDIKSNGAVLQGRLPLSRHRRTERGRAGRAGRSDPAAAPPDALGGDLFRRKAAECAHRTSTSAVCFVIGGIMLYYASLPKTEDEALALTQLQKTR